MTPSCMHPSNGRMPTPTIRAFQIGCPVSSLSYSGSRESITLMNSLIRSIEPSGSSWATPPGRMKAMFIRSPVRNSIRCRASSRSRKPAVMAVNAPSSMPPVASATRCEEIRVSSISSTRITCARTGTSIPSNFSTAMQ